MLLAFLKTQRTPLAQMSSGIDSSLYSPLSSYGSLGPMTPLCIADQATNGLNVEPRLYRPCTARLTSTDLSGSALPVIGSTLLPKSWSNLLPSMAPIQRLSKRGQLAMARIWPLELS